MTDEEQYTVENAALNHYSNWWQASEEGDSRYMTRWERLQANIKEGELVEVSRLIREAHAYAYIAGFTLRLTGEK